MKNENRTDPESLSKVSNRYTRKFENNLRKVKHNIKLDMTSTRLIISYRLETEYGSTLARRYRRVKERNSITFDMDPSLS
jgi:hypothetical protein